MMLKILTLIKLDTEKKMLPSSESSLYKNRKKNIVFSYSHPAYILSNILRRVLLFLVLFFKQKNYLMADRLMVLKKLNKIFKLIHKIKQNRPLVTVKNNIIR